MKLGKYIDVQQNEDRTYTIYLPNGQKKILSKEEFNKQRLPEVLGEIERQCKTYRFIIGEEIKTLKEWSEQYNRNPLLVHNRIFKLGWHITEALITPPGEKRVKLLDLYKSNEEETIDQEEATEESKIVTTSTSITKRRERPKGSKNKAKLSLEVESPRSYFISGYQVL
jgi:hypothetical protein